MKAATVFVSAVVIVDTFLLSYAVGFNSRHVLVIDPNLPPVKVEAPVPPSTTNTKTEAKDKASADKPKGDGAKADKSKGDGANADAAKADNANAGKGKEHTTGGGKAESAAGADKSKKHHKNKKH
ncbi:MAG TPA: hypothetical protein V6D22_11470 [Candidatus Obscuribacterales bacterium]